MESASWRLFGIWHGVEGCHKDERAIPALVGWG